MRCNLQGQPEDFVCIVASRRRYVEERIAPEGNQNGSYVPWTDDEGIETLEDFFRTDPKIVEDDSPIDFERKDPEEEVEADLLLP